MEKALKFISFLVVIRIIYGHSLAWGEDFASDKGKIVEQKSFSLDALPMLPHHAHVFFTADFLYWYVAQEGLEYAYSSIGLGINQRAQVRAPSFQAEPGFKVGFGFYPGHDGWDIYTEYTWLHSSVSDRLHEQSNTIPDTLLGFWRAGFLISDNTPINLATSKWSFAFNVIDLELGRNYFISKYLKLRPHFGIKGTWQDQHYKASYFSDSPSGFLRIKQDNWGVGVRSGLDTSWQISSIFSFYGDIAMSGLYSKFHIKRKDTLTADDITSPLAFFSNQVHPIKLVLEWGLGIRFENSYYSKTLENYFHLLFQIGWEEQYWYSQNEFPTIGESYVGRGGDLSMQGLTAKLRFDF